jgi:hypothetical protein
MEGEFDGDLPVDTRFLECVTGKDGGRKYLKNAGTYTASQPEEAIFSFI